MDTDRHVLAKIVIALLAAIVLALPIAVYSASLEAETFWDLLPEDPYAESITQLRSMGVLVGYPDGSFRGNEPVTRRELAIVVGRMIGYFEAALPAAVEPRELTQIEIESLRKQGPVVALDGFAQREIDPGPIFGSTLDSSATVDDVANLLNQAIAYLTERVIGQDKGVSSDEGHSHSDH